MPEEQFERFCASIKRHGLQEPILRWRGLVVQGRQRLRGCILTGTPPRFAEWVPKGRTTLEIEAEICVMLLTKDIDRRHLTKGQIATAANELWGPADAEGQILGMNRAQQGAAIGVSHETLRQTREVIKRGSEALKQAMRDDVVKPYDALNILDLNKRDQTRVLRDVESGKAKTVTAASVRVRREGHIKGASDKTDEYIVQLELSMLAETHDLAVKMVVRANPGCVIRSVRRPGKAEREFLGFCIGEECHRGIYKGDAYVKRDGGRFECNECRPGAR